MKTLTRLAIGVSKKQKYVVGILVLMLIPTFFMLIRPGYFWMQDDLQAFRVLEMFKCFQDLQLPCRWVPDPGYQYGYPQFIFYPPSVYYIGAVLHLLGIPIIDSVKLLFVVGFILSAVGMYGFINSWLGKWPAVVSALVYTYVPYKALEVYVRGALSEFWSLVIFPFIFWAILSICQRPGWRKVGFLALAMALLLLTHNLMTVIFMPFVAVWAIYWLYWSRSISVAMKIGVGLSLGIGLALWFSLPVVVEKQFAHLETLVGGYFDYRAHFVDIKRLFFSNHWGYGSSGLNQDNDLSLSVGIGQWMLAAIAVVLGIIKRKDKKISGAIFLLAILSLMSAFMIHQKSSFIWSMIPSLEFMQFPWRFLGINIFVNSILAGLGVYLVMKINLKWAYWYGVIAILLVFGLTIGFFHPKEWYPIGDSDKFSGKLWEKQLTISIFDYLPIYAKYPPVHKAPDYPEVLEGSVVFDNYHKGSNFQTSKFEVTQSAVLRLPIYDFPGMTVYVNGQRIDHWNNDCRGQEFCLGLVTIKLNSGRYEMVVRLEDTPVRKWSLIVSGLTLILVVGLIRKK